MEETTHHEEEGMGEEMTLFDHLAELRRRLAYCLLATAVGFGVAWTWVEDIFDFIAKPLKTAAPNAAMGQLNYKSLTEPFFTLVKTAIVAGIFLAIPVILWQLWKFIAPGLYKHEKRLAIPFVFMATVFFFGGASFCYFFVMSFGFQFLFQFGNAVATPTLMMSDHYDLAVKMLLAFGAIFEMPVIAMFMSALGLITHRTLIKFWRLSVVGAFIFAAVLTPPDVVTQVAMAIPLVVLYGISTIVAYFFTVRRERKNAEELAELDARINEP